VREEPRLSVGEMRVRWYELGDLTHFDQSFAVIVCFVVIAVLADYLRIDRVAIDSNPGIQALFHNA